MHTGADQICFLQKLTLNGARERIAKKSYIRAPSVAIPYFDVGLASARQKGGAPTRSRAATTPCLICPSRCSMTHTMRGDSTSGGVVRMRGPAPWWPRSAGFG